MVWAIGYPAQEERCRLYVVFRLADQATNTVVKVGAGDSNRGQLQNEAAVLRQLADHALSFGRPEVLFCERLSGEIVALVLTGFPLLARHVSARQAARIADEVIEGLQTVSGRSDSRARGGLTGWAHGDLGPGNMLLTDDKSGFVYDWESARSDAPALVDRVAFWLSCRQKAALKHPKAALRALQIAFPTAQGPQILRALDFLRSHQNVAADNVISVWEGEVCFDGPPVN